MSTGLAAGATEAPNRLEFACDMLSVGGALVEREPVTALAVLPPALARELQVPEACELTSEPGFVAEGRHLVEFGTELLEKLVERAARFGGIACASLEAETPRLSQARALAERLVIRNGVHEVSAVSFGHATYLRLWMSFAAECDDRHEGLVSATLCEHNGGQPDSALTEWLDPTRQIGLAPAQEVPLARGASDGLARFMGARLPSLIGPALLQFQNGMQRRHERDYRRLNIYFEDLAREAQKAAARKRLDPAALSEKLQHFARERDAKLVELTERFRLRVTAAPVAALRVSVPVAFVNLRVRRRKGERALTLTLPSGAGAFDQVACEGCLRATSTLALCDERLHVLCDTCAPLAQGRIRCPACSSHGT